MAVKAVKFGGSSLANAAQFKKVAAIISGPGKALCGRFRTRQARCAGC